MSAPQPRLLETYNSLTDKHLVGYFSNARIRRHLQKSGLISRSGRIIPEKEYRLNARRMDHQRSVQECLADAIFHKILDMEHHHWMKKKKNLECSGSKERMQPIKVEEIRESVEEVIHVHCPHPPLTPRNCHGLCPLVAGERAGRSRWRAPRLGVDCDGGCCCCRHQHRAREPVPSKVSSLRPNTAPGNMQHSPYLQPLPGWAAAGSVPKASRQKWHALEHDQQLACGGRRRGLRLLGWEQCPSSPWLPVAPGCPVPAPPACLRRGLGQRSALRGGLPVERWFHPTTAFNQQLLIRNTKGFPKSPLCSNALVTMAYLGKSKHVSLREYKDEIKVYQQHCGTENICVYRGELLEGDTFQFTSKRYLGFPFSLTFYLNGLQVERLSCCCEYRGVQNKRRSRLQRRNSYFRVLHATGAPPCYRCLVAMGLDKKLCPPKRKARRYCDKHLCCCGHALPCASSIEEKSKENSESVTVLNHEASVETIEETLETREESSEEEMKTQTTEESEDSQEDTSKDEYDEDFEAYEEVNEEGQTGDQMNRMSETSSDDKKHNLDYGKESEASSQKALQACESEKDESERYSDDRDSEDDLQERRPADSLSSMSTQCSTDSHAEMMTDNVSGKEDCSIKSASDSAAHDGNENGEKKLLRMEENQETIALEKKGIDGAEKTKPEDLTAMKDTRTFHESIMSMQHQNPDVNGEFKQTGSGESNMNEEKCPPVPWESRALDTEGGREESPWSEEGGVLKDCKPVQEEIAKATGNDHPVHSDPEPGDSCANEEEKNAANTECDASGGGSFLAEGRRSLDVQEAAGRAVREGQGRALELDGAAEGRAGSGEPGAGAARAGNPLPRAGNPLPQAGNPLLRAGNSLPRAGTGAALEGSAPEEGAVAEEHPKGKGTGEAVKLGTGVSPGQQEEGMEREEALGKPAAGGDGALPGWAADRAGRRGWEGAGGITGGEEEEAAEEGLKGAVGLPAQEEMGEPVSEAGETLGQGGSAGKDAVGAVSQGGEAVEDADVAADGIAGAVDPEGEEAVEDISEREEAMGKPGVLWEALGDMETGEAMPGGEGFVNPSEFSQLKASGEEWMEMGKAVAGAAALEGVQTWEVEGNALQRVEDTVEKSVEPDKGPVLEVAPGLRALGGARGDPVTEGSSQVEERPAVQEEQGAAEALGSGNPTEGSKAETERAGEGKPEGEVTGGSAGAAGAGSGGEEEATDGAAGSKEPAAGTEGWLECGKVRGDGTCPGEGEVGEAALPPLGLCGARAGEPGLVAIAVLGGQAAGLALDKGLAQAGGLALAGVGTGAIAQEGAIGAVLAAQSGTEEAVGASGRDGEGVADGREAGGRAGEAAGGCEGRAAVPAAAEAGRESGAAWPGCPGHREVLGTESLGEQPSAETSPSTPARGDGGAEPRGTGAEGLCPGARPQLAAPEPGTRSRDGRQEGTEQAGVKAGGEQSPCDSAGEVADVSGSAAAAGGPGEDGAVGRSPGVPAAAGVGEGSRSPRQDGANPDPLIVFSEQPQDGEETRL